MTSPSEETVATTYEIVVSGAVSDDLVADLGAQAVEASQSKTLIVIDIIDQSHLHGVLGWLQDRNIAIERVNPSDRPSAGQ